MAENYPWHVRETAIWLYLRHELSSKDVAARLNISHGTVTNWTNEEKVTRSKKAAWRLRVDHQNRKPELFQRRLEVRRLREEEKLTFKAIGARLDIAESLAWLDYKVAKQYDVKKKPKPSRPSRIEPVRCNVKLFEG